MMSNRLIDLAIELADEAARSDIECMCLGVLEDGGQIETVAQFSSRWYDTESAPDSADRDSVIRALEYLDLRGLFRRHPLAPTRIHLLSHPSDTRAA